MISEHTVLSVLERALGEGKQEASSFPFVFDRGDIQTAADQANQFARLGYKVKWSDVYPAVGTLEEYKRCLELLWGKKIRGWYQYKKECVNYGICTKEEFEKAMEEINWGSENKPIQFNNKFQKIRTEAKMHS